MSVMPAAAHPAGREVDRVWRDLWAPCLAALVALRVLIPLVALAASPGRFPLLPAYDRVYLNGDANGYYEAITNLFDAFRSVLVGGAGVVALAALAASLLGAVWAWRRGWRAAAVLLPATVGSIAITLVVSDMAAPGAPVVGWPLAWALGLFPLPLLGLELTPARAFPVGLAVGLAANGVTTVATAYLGFRASGRRSVGVAAAALFATWPVWVGLVAGHRAWENGQWNVDVGLHLYTEPLSTALVAVTLAVLLGPAPGAAATAASGLALGFATVVKLTNGLIGLALAPLVLARHGTRRAAAFAAGGIVSLPIAIAYWPKGYVQIYDGAIAPVPAYSFGYIGANLGSSTIFTRTLLLLLVVPALVGIHAVDGWYSRSVLVWPIVATVLAYAAYYVTDQHPRFLYVALPPLFALQAAGVRSLVVRALP